MRILSAFEKPLAIAMWDSSWLRRRYRGGGFEDWDRALNELTARGYDAVRIDAFPHLVADGPDGTRIDVYKDVPNHSPNFYGFGMWGPQWTQYINPRESLPAFVKKCGEHGVKVNLSTWFKPTADGRNAQLEGAESIVRVWNETLQLLESENCLDTVFCLDFLNELPGGFCMTWYHDMLRMLRSPAPDPGERFNARQKEFIRSFVNGIIDGLKTAWPDLPVAASIIEGDTCGDTIDLSAMDFIDNHIWVMNDKRLTDGTGYYETVCVHGHPDHLYKREPVPGTTTYDAPRYRFVPQDSEYDKTYEKLLENWNSKRAELTAWMQDKITETARLGKEHGIPVGCTEGWGMVMWAEHPLLEWDIHRGAAEIAARAGAEAGFAFNCSSNFCHPYHLGYWENEEWHRSVTGIIKSGTPEAVR